MSTDKKTSAVLANKNVAKFGADVLVLGITPAEAKGGSPSVVSATDLPTDLAARLNKAAAALKLTGAPEEFHRLAGMDGIAADSVALIGLGKDADDEASRRAAGAATRQLAGAGHVAIALPASSTETLGAVAEGALLGAYSFDNFRSATKADRKAPVEKLTILNPQAREKSAQAALSRAVAVAAAVHGTRDLVNQPPSHLFPASFAESIRNQAKGRPVKVTVLDEGQLAKDGYGGLIGVGQGSSRPPRLVKVAYTPAKPAAHLALVGKGITFDSGGISLKPAAGMEEMKMDMAGAASVVQALFAVADLQLPVRVTAWLALAENMPSGTAQRPSDVVSIYGGRTVEVLNTDAEGRLVLADGIVAASEEDPDLIVDVATLTGAQMVALGNRVSAVMGDDDTRDKVVAAAKRAGEQFWPMPLPAELRKSLDSAVADISNIGERFGGMLVAGLFLQEFVGRVGAKRGADSASDDGAPRIPWAHLDIAGPAFNSGTPHGYTHKEGTGVSVRTLVALAEDLAGR
ncbi:leucyl aminopeptidase [Saxibacter everestensis]|uniref:Probable cytosol aminopeptidase n=1 Tax=Saxibacter everestensis TaxID=2909229 RepID=A0ABY8QX03_9MICO|nr:leucyl aminopeptidase [Brevibacteriaceae bacterium ZFBP1038]